MEYILWVWPFQAFQMYTETHNVRYFIIITDYVHRRWGLCRINGGQSKYHHYFIKEGDFVKSKTLAK